MRESADRAFQAYVRQLDTVTSFKYQGRVLTELVNDWPAVVGNLKKSRKSWSWLMSILGQEGANPRVSGMFFKAVVQAVLIFGSATWVLNPHIRRDLGSLKHGVSRGITGRHPRGGLVISTAGDSNGGVGIQGDRGLNNKKAEHGCTIYCNAADSGPLREGSAEAGA